MRKVGLILLMFILTIVLTVGSAFAAGVVGTPHDVTKALDAFLPDPEPHAGTCSVCHVPHKAVGSRLWFEAMGAGFGKGIVGNLCASCHGGSAGGRAGALPLASLAIGTVYYTYAHGNVDMGAAAGGAYVSNAELQAASSLPYTNMSTDTPPDAEDTLATVNTIQCTSCHNVHQNQFARPFLRVSIRDLCVKCHGTRAASGVGTFHAAGNSAVITTWGANLGTANPGSHPVGTDITGEMDAVNPDSPIMAWTAIMQPFDDSTDGTIDIDNTGDPWSGTGVWNLGLHTADGTATSVPGTGNAVGEGVVCVSCHAIHGVQDDTNPAVVQVSPTINLLARPQAVGPGLTVNGIGTDVANGMWAGGAQTALIDLYAAGSESALTDGANRLCEYCHHASPWGDTAFMENDGTSYTNGVDWNQFYPNPGATLYNHPIDDATVVNSAVDDFPANWPQGDDTTVVAGSLTTPRPICESCHIPHPERARANSRPDVRDIWGGLITDHDYILRDSVGDICTNCHLGSVAGHHPITRLNSSGVAIQQDCNYLFGSTAAAVSVMSFTGPVPAVAATGVPGANGFIGDADNILECSDCHAFAGAHNWTGANQVGLDPDWWPPNNGRTAADDQASENIIDNLATLPYSTTNGLSATCEQCHYALNRGGANWAAAYVDGATPTHDNGADWCTETEYQDQAGELAGAGTHFLGTVNTGLADRAVKGWLVGLVQGDATFNPTSELWPNGNAAPKKLGWSRWGNTTAGAHLVCESCHELEPDKNATYDAAGTIRSKLLLLYFQENVNNPLTGDNLSTSYFCEGCHGANGPNGTHAMTGDTVTRTGQLLNTETTAAGFSRLLDPQAPKALPNTGAVGYSTFPGGVGADLLSCDGCHQTHDAATNSATYILDSPDINVGDVGADGSLERGGVNADSSNGRGHPLANTTAVDSYEPDLNYTLYCDQCHWYTWDTRS